MILKKLLPGIKGNPKRLQLATYDVFRDDPNQDVDDILRKWGPCVISNFKVHPRLERAGDKHQDKVGYWKFSGSTRSTGDFVHFKDDPNVQQELESARESLMARKVPDNDGSEERSLPSPRNLEKDVKPTVASSEASFSDRDVMPRTRQDKIENHAMVLLGGQKEGKKVWMLLQNWWSTMQLVEVCYDYFMECEGHLAYFAEAGYDPKKSRHTDCLLHESIANRPVLQFGRERKSNG